jgi:hypothetical protein
MKKILLLLLVTISIVSCNKVGKDEFVITGKADGVADGVAVYLQKQDSTGLVQVDTVKVQKGKFEFKGKFVEPGIHYIEVDKVQGKAVLILESGEIAMAIRKDTISKSKASGTVSNDQLAVYMTESEKINKKMMAFQKANMVKFQEANTKKDTVTINALMKENSVFEKQFEKLSMENMDKNPKSFLSLIFLQQFMSSPVADKVKLKKTFEGLDISLQNTKVGKKLKKELGVTTK